MTEKQHLNKLSIGLLLGICAPIITLFIVYLYSFDNYTVKEFFDFLRTMKITTKLFSLCVIPNLALFFIFIWTNRNRSAKGVLTATFILAISITIVQIALGELF